LTQGYALGVTLPQQQDATRQTVRIPRRQMQRHLEAPVNLDQVQERAKDIQYASKTRFNTTRIKEVRELLMSLKNVLGKLPKSMQADPDVQRLEQVTQRGPMCLVHFINRRLSHAASFKDYEFSRATIDELWQEGLRDVHRSMAHPD
jgi:NTE family protein